MTLFASGDSCTSARLVATCPKALRTRRDCQDPLAHHLLMIERVRKHWTEFDVVHFHIDYLHFPYLRRQSGGDNATPAHVTTLHGRLDIPDLVPLYQEFIDVPVVSISLAQRRPLPWINWVGNVYHGLPEGSLEFCPEPQGYLAFIGRISPEKRPDRAIEIARRAGLPLKIAAKVDRSDLAYFDARIKPLLSQPGVEFLGEIGDQQKSEFLGNALACLAPIDWPEPFGLNLIESMACGTPTIAFRCGSVPEIIEPGISGFIVDSVEEAVAAVRRVSDLSRRDCRKAFERRFTAERMANDYLAVYEEQLEATRSSYDLPIPPLAEMSKTEVVSEDFR